MVDRRKVLAGLAGLGSAAALPAWAQAIRPQSDPWAQVNPYDDPRNGFGGEGRGGRPQPAWRDGHGAPQEWRATGGGGTDDLTLADRVEIESAVQSYQMALFGPKKAQGPRSDNEAAQQALQRFCAPFFQVADRANLPWEVTLTEYSPNGFTVGGGKVALTTGLVTICDHPGELASVLAHEIGHVDSRHAARTNAILDLIGAAEKAGKIPGQDNPLFQRHLDQMLFVAVRGYTRTNEFEADAHIIPIMDRLGMNPGRYIVFERKLMKLYNRSPDQKTCVLDTHPATIERIEAFQAELGNDRPDNYVPPGWEDLKRLFPTPPEFAWG